MEDIRGTEVEFNWSITSIIDEYQLSASRFVIFNSWESARGNHWKRDLWEAEPVLRQSGDKSNLLHFPETEPLFLGFPGAIFVTIPKKSDSEISVKR